MSAHGQNSRPIILERNFDGLALAVAGTPILNNTEFGPMTDEKSDFLQILTRTCRES